MEEENIPNEVPVEVTPSDRIAEANVAAKRMEDAVAAMKKENDRLESLRVQETLSGKADVSVTKKEESPREYAEKVLSNDL